MNTPDPKNQNTSPDDVNTDVTRSQNRQAAGAAQGDGTNRMGAESNDTGSRPSNSDANNQKTAQEINANATGGHQEGQYPQNGENQSI